MSKDFLTEELRLGYISEHNKKDFNKTFYLVNTVFVKRDVRKYKYFLE